jgi:hypothetical protein
MQPVSGGIGSAMRVAAVGEAFESVDDVLREAERSAGVTHNHIEEIKGAQATADQIRSTYEMGCGVSAVCPGSDHDVLGFSRCRRCDQVDVSLGGEADTRRPSREASPRHSINMCPMTWSFPFASGCLPT